GGVGAEISGRGADPRLRGGRVLARHSFAQRADWRVRIVIGPYHLVGDVEIGSAPQDRSLLHHHRIAVLLAEAADYDAEVVEDLAGDFAVLALQIVAGVLEVAV